MSKKKVSKASEKTVKVDLYFAGSFTQESNDYIKQRKGCRLYSFANDKKAIDDWSANKQGTKLLIDSGAYSVFKSGAKVNIDNYIEWLNEKSVNFKHFIQLDDIPGEFGRPATLEEVKISPVKSWTSYLYMRCRLKEPLKLLPVFHNGEDYSYLKQMLEYKDDLGNIPYICLAPMHNVTRRERYDFVERCFNIIKSSSNPHVKVHLLGVTIVDILEKYPITSADSTSWIQTAINGGIITPFGVFVVSEKSEEKTKHYKSLPEAVQKKLEEYVTSQGFKMEELANNTNLRGVFNLKYFQDWVEHYERKEAVNSIPNLFDL